MNVCINCGQTTSKRHKQGDTFHCQAQHPDTAPMEPEAVVRHLRKTIGCLEAEHPDTANIADRLLYVLDRIV